MPPLGTVDWTFDASVSDAAMDLLAESPDPLPVPEPNRVALQMGALLSILSLAGLRRRCAA